MFQNGHFHLRYTFGLLSLYVEPDHTKNCNAISPKNSGNQISLPLLPVCIHTLYVSFVFSRKMSRNVYRAAGGHIEYLLQNLL